MQKKSNAKKEKEEDLESMQMPSEDEDWEEEEEEGSSKEEEDDEEPSKDSEGSSGSEAEASEQETSVRKAMMKRKRKFVERKSKTPAKKPKQSPSTSSSKTRKVPKVTDSQAPPNEPAIIEEKSHPGEEKEDEKDDKKATLRSGKKEYKLFNDKNLDVDFHKDPDSIISRRIRLNGNYIVTCKTIQLNGDGAFDYAALIIEKKMKDQRCFEFNIPLNLAPRLIDAVKEIMKENPRFFYNSIQ